MAKLILLDRDDTIIVDKGYLADPAGLELLPGAVEGMRQLQMLGYRLVIVTNQSGVARGYFTETTLQAIHTHLAEMLRAEGITLAGIYYCPHGPGDDCNCRKPRPGLALQAARDCQGDLKQSYVIGDKDSDIGLAKAVEAKGILIAPRDAALTPTTYHPDAICSNLVEAVQWIEALTLTNAQLVDRNG